MRSKEVVFGLFLLMFGFLTGFGWEKIPDAPYWILAVFGFAVTFAFFLLFAVNFWLRWALPALSLLLVTVSLTPNLFLFTGFAVGAIFILLAVWISEKEYNVSCEFACHKVVGKSLKIFFTALAVLFAFSYYGNIQGKPDVVSLLVPRKVFSATISVLEKPIHALFPGLTVGSIVEEALTTEQIDEFSREFGVIIESGETLSDVLYKFSLARISEITQPYSAYIDVLAAASLFFALKLVSVLLYFVTILFVSFMVWFLLLVGVFRKVNVPTTKEMIV